MNLNDICILDFETGGRNPNTCEILQIGAIVIDSRTLARKDNFSSFVKPHDFDLVEDDALKVNGITREFLEELSDAYYPEVIWTKFASWVNKYNRSKGAPSPFNAPVMCGFNIINFDKVLVERYCQKYGPSDQRGQKLFNQVNKIDIYDIVFIWFEHNNAIDNLKLTTIAEHLGVQRRKIDRAHDALCDCEICADVLCEYLRRSRLKLPSMNYMKDMLKKGENIDNVEAVNER